MLSDSTSPSGDGERTGSDKIRVMLVDDSSFVRHAITNIIQAPDIEIVASVSNGKQAVDIVDKKLPDILILDVEMPVMDGITALPLILEKSPKTKVIMCSTLTVRNAEITMKALQLGAADTIAKPTSSSEVNRGEDFKNNILRVVRALAGRRGAPVHLRSPSSTSTAERTAVPSSMASAEKKEVGVAKNSEFSLYKSPNTYVGRPDVIAIGSSTGGPKALFTVLTHLKNIDVPIVMTQHMPATFTKILANHIQQMTGIDALEAEEGMVLEPGKIYVAPGGKHMLVVKKGDSTVVSLDDGPQENFCKPSVDPMLRSVIKTYGKKILMVMLTGMGSDGLESSKQLVEAGGKLIAQDEATSTVWGMPGAVAKANICHDVLPLDQIGPRILREIGRA
jgi:two-component system chemotaxis response regulator CheB